LSNVISICLKNNKRNVKEKEKEEKEKEQKTKV